ncbi:helix-turn-helix domain-containing protein [Bacilliculturomica massiliensis]|uniref:helix-turn-helix domain-containing protein n=1 Tax=Bacilliculturomica massiliensis TaxID=1917867 RepID=UPI0013EF0A34|nr:helix-turn-helix transcriptional regulator [Bacilliculturomica massiliensis]
MDELRTAIVKRLVEYRVKRGFTQETLALTASMDPAYVGKIERGQVNLTISTLEKLLKGLNVSYAEFLRFDLDVTASENPFIDKIAPYIDNLSVEDEKYIYDTVKFVYTKRDRTE